MESGSGRRMNELSLEVEVEVEARADNTEITLAVEQGHNIGEHY